jgi:hypothetical protein
MMEKDRVRFAGVRSPQENQISLFDLPVGTGAPASSENRRQTGDARRVSGAVTAIDVVTADDDPGELLSHVIHLIGRLRATEQPERPWPMTLDGRLKPVSGTGHRLFPRRGPQASTISD